MFESRMSPEEEKARKTRDTRSFGFAASSSLDSQQAPSWVFGNQTTQAPKQAGLLLHSNHHWTGPAKEETVGLSLLSHQLLQATSSLVLWKRQRTESLAIGRTAVNPPPLLGFVYSIIVLLQFTVTCVVRSFHHGPFSVFQQKEKDRRCWQWQQ